MLYLYIAKTGDVRIDYLCNCCHHEWDNANLDSTFCPVCRTSNIKCFAGDPYREGDIVEVREEDTWSQSERSNVIILTDEQHEEIIARFSCDGSALAEELSKPKIFEGLRIARRKYFFNYTTQSIEEK